MHACQTTSFLSDSLCCCGLDPTMKLLCPIGFSRQEYWSGVPFPSPGDLPDLGIEPMSLMSPALAGRFFTISAAGIWISQIWSSDLSPTTCITFRE